jgi:hypothetical protein
MGAAILSLERKESSSGPENDQRKPSSDGSLHHREKLHRNKVVGADLARADDYLFSPYQQHPPTPDSIRRDRLEPWPATYWKVLPVGHRIRFAYDPDRIVTLEYGSGVWLRSRDWLEDVNHWFTRDGA